MENGTSDLNSPAAKEDAVATVLPAVTALVVDVAAAKQSHAQQDALTDFVWHMLERDYQIYLCSSTTKDGGPDELRGQSFAHRGLTWLPGAMPPSKAQLGQFPALAAATTLWISDDTAIESWVRQLGLPFVSLGRGTASFSDRLQLAGWGELAGLLDPTAQTVRQVAEAIAELRRTRPPGPILVGIGGPPASGFESFALELKRTLESGPLTLVDLLDLSGFVSIGKPRSGGQPAAGGGFPRDAGDKWLVERVLHPLAAGEAVYVEQASDVVPEEFRHHFPMYLSPESIVLVLGEAVFQRAIRDLLHLAVLVEVGAAETARRLFEIPDGETFDEAFVEQYLERDGREYNEYLAQNQVIARADLRIDGNSAKRFTTLPVAMGRN